MNRIGLILISLSSLLLAVMLIFIGNTDNLDACLGTFTVVEAPNQTGSMESEEFRQEEYVAPVMEGENVALGTKAAANGFNDVYQARNVVDGARGTYWEGSPDTSEDILTVNLKACHDIYAIVVGLNPASVWSKRTQTISFAVSTDGEEYVEIVPQTKYEFDPKTGNQIVVEFETVAAQYVRAVFTSNSGAVGGQVAEFEVYEK